MEIDRREEAVITGAGRETSKPFVVHVSAQAEFIVGQQTLFDYVSEGRVLGHWYQGRYALLRWDFP